MRIESRFCKGWWVEGVVRWLLPLVGHRTPVLAKAAFSFGGEGYG